MHCTLASYPKEKRAQQRAGFQSKITENGEFRNIGPCIFGKLSALVTPNNKTLWEKDPNLLVENNNSG